MSEYLDKITLALESRLSVRTWERLIAQGRIPTTRVGRRVLVRRSDFITFMDEHRKEAIAPDDVRGQLEALAQRALEKAGL